MKKNILLILAIFSLVALAGGVYLAYSSESNLSNFITIIRMHHVENLREHLLLRIQKVEIDLYSQQTAHPESTAAVEDDVIEMEKLFSGCYGCHHAPEAEARLDDLRQQIDQYKDAISRVVALPAGSRQQYNRHVGVHLIGESLVGKVETMVVTTSERLREQTENSLRKAHGMKIIMMVFIAAGPFMMIIFAFKVMRGVTRPVQVLLEATRKLKSGNLEHRIPGLRDEFGELAVAFNDMAAAVRATMHGIEESEKRYRLLFESAGDAIFILEAEGPEAGKILQVNETAARMHGYTVEELTTMKIQDLDTPDAAEEVPSRVERILQGEWIKLEMRHRRRDNTIFPVEVSAGLLETGGHKFILAIDRDITERKQAEEELQRTERFRLAGELATGLAHEVKNPLAGIKVSMEVLSEETYLTEEDRDVLRKVILEIKRLEFLMKGFLNFARPPKPQLTSTDVNSILETVASLVLKENSRSRDDSHLIRVSYELQKDIPEIMADPMQLKQIFMNLILNAVDAMPEGGTLTVRTARSRESRSLTVEIADSGSGIESATMSKIFNPFFTTKAKGTGLGLSITRRLVEEHGGKINIANNDTGGVTCTVILPVRQREGALA